MNMTKDEIKEIKKKRYQEKINQGIKKKVINECRQNCYNLESYPEYNNDRDVVLIAINCNGKCLRYASDELKSDEEIITIACMNNINAIIYIDESYKGNKDFLNALYIGVGHVYLQYF